MINDVKAIIPKSNEGYEYGDPVTSRILATQLGLVIILILFKAIPKALPFSFAI